MFSVIYAEGLCEIYNSPNDETSEDNAFRETQDHHLNKPFDNISIFYLPLFNSATKHSVLRWNKYEVVAFPFTLTP